MIKFNLMHGYKNLTNSATVCKETEKAICFTYTDYVGAMQKPIFCYLWIPKSILKSDNKNNSMDSEDYKHLYIPHYFKLSEKRISSKWV